MAFDSAGWKRRLSEVLKEHPDIARTTGMLEVNLNEGGITRVYLNKRIRNAAEIDQSRDKIESISVRIIIG